MPLTTLTCPICLGMLKLKTAVAEGGHIRCPKCKGSFVAEAEPKPPFAEPIHEPILTEQQEPMPEPAAAVPEAEEVLETAELDEVAEAPPPSRSRPSREDDDRPRRRPARRDDEEEDEEEDGRNRFRKQRKKGIPTWVWLVSGGVGLMLLLGCCSIGGIIVWSTMSGMAVNMDNYNKIQGHMTPEQVQAILGQPSGAGGFTGFGSQQWKNGDDYIVVTFVNGRAFGKACHLRVGFGGTVDRSDILGP